MSQHVYKERGCHDHTYDVRRNISITEPSCRNPPFKILAVGRKVALGNCFKVVVVACIDDGIPKKQKCWDSYIRRQLLQGADGADNREKEHQRRIETRGHYCFFVLFCFNPSIPPCNQVNEREESKMFRISNVSCLVCLYRDGRWSSSRIYISNHFGRIRMA